MDCNVLLYGVNADAAQHVPARRWLDTALSSTEVVGFAWIVLLAFLRIATSPRAFRAPLPALRAFETVQDWLAQPAGVLVSPTSRHLPILRSLIEQSGTAGNLVADAHLAALAVEHGASVVSFDRDFLRFPGLRLAVPS